MNKSETSRAERLRIWTDRLFILYLLITSSFILIFHHLVTNWGLLVSLHLIAAWLISCLSRKPVLQSSFWSFVRDWYPVPLFLVFYKEVEFLALSFGNWGLTDVIRQADQFIFGGQPSIFLSQFMPWLFFSEYIHFCYFFHNIQIPLVGGYLYATYRLAFRELILLVGITLCTSFIFYILFPVDSPYYLAPPLEKPLSEGFFYQLVHFASERGGARGGAFPSSHVSVSTTIWLVVWLRRRVLAYLLLPITLGLIFATVYARFHYVLDSIVGFLWAAVIFAVYCFWSRCSD